MRLRDANPGGIRLNAYANLLSMARTVSAQPVEAKLDRILERLESAGKLLRPVQAAKFCGVSERTFRDWIGNNRITTIKIANTIMIDRDDLLLDLSKYKVRSLGS